MTQLRRVLSDITPVQGRPWFAKPSFHEELKEGIAAVRPETVNKPLFAALCNRAAGAAVTVTT